MLDRFEHRAVEVIQALPLQSTVKNRADSGAGQPKVDVIHLVGHRVLDAFQSAIDEGEVLTGRKLTLIIVRATPTEPKTALAGVIVEASFARFKASMAAFNVETAPSRSLGRLEGSAMVVKTEGSCGERRGTQAVGKAVNPDRDEPHLSWRPSCKQVHLVKCEENHRIRRLRMCPIGCSPGTFVHSPPLAEEMLGHTRIFILACTSSLLRLRPVRPLVM